MPCYLVQLSHTGRALASSSLFIMILHSATTVAIVATRSLCETPQPLSELENGECSQSRKTVQFQFV